MKERKCRCCHQVLPPPPGGLSILEREEKRVIRELLAENGWNLAKTAQELRIATPTLTERIKRYGLKRQKHLTAKDCPVGKPFYKVVADHLGKP